MRLKIPSLVLALLLVPCLAIAQSQGTVRGTVTDGQSGETIPGVNVALIGTGQGAATNPQGQFRITGVEPGTYTLRASFVGYQQREREINVEAGETTVANIQMSPADVELDEVVVTGYRTQRREDVSGSISNVSSDDLENIPAQNAESLLQGRAAGVQISSTSGNPGSGFEVNIRGEGSINAGNRPLYIVDGVQVSFEQGAALNDRSPLNAISPGDIESIEVLKDAAASAIYGAQASNGVVLITTKSGRSGDTRVSLNFEGGVRTPNVNYNVLNTEEWVDLNIDALGEPAFRAAILPTYGYASDTPLGELRDFGWKDFVTRTGAHRKVGFTANGGSESTQFYLSGNWNSTEAGLRAVSYESYNFRANLSQELTSDLDVDVKVALSSQDQPGVCQDGFFVNCPWSGIQFEPPISFPFLENGDYNPNTSFGLNNNQAVVLNEEERSTKATQIIGNISPTYNITSWLQLNGSLGLDWQRLREQDYEPPIADPGAGGSTRTLNNTITNLTTNVTLNANRTFGEVHNVNMLVGSEYRREFEQEDDFSVQGFNNPLLSAPDAASQIGFFSGFNTEYRLLSGFGSVNYNYDDRYVVRLTGRYDGTSRFGSDRQFGFFPSGSLAWRIHQEEFFTADFVDELKARVSYGITGNSSIGNFASRGLYSVAGSYRGQVGFRPNQIANPRLTWEENREVNAGIDWALWESRVTGSLDLYRSNTDQLLLGRPLPRTSGFAEINENVGSVRNQGVELSLETVNVQTEDFRWSTRVNLAINQNEVLELNEGQESIDSGGSLPVAVGQSQEAWKVPLWAGVNPADGRPMFYDEDGNITYRPTEADDVFFDGGEEDVEGGFGTQLGYKGLSLDAFFQFSYGAHSLPNTERAFLSNQGAFSAGHELLTDRWREPGDVTDVARAVPNGNFPNADNFSTISSYWLYDSSYLRLKSLRLSYSLPSSVTEAIQLRGAQVYVGGYNLLTWTSYIGLDPEVAGGFTESSYPTERQFNVGVQIDL